MAQASKQGRKTSTAAPASSAVTALLATYLYKRDFMKTGEPSGATSPASGNGFVVQKHEASRLHYDLRPELYGVLKSWAVTRGPGPNPDDKRLAVRTEDHPLGYATFEGTIPKGEYGGGTMMLRDTGTWESVPGKDPSKTLIEGHLHFVLHGSRMNGRLQTLTLTGGTMITLSSCVLGGDRGEPQMPAPLVELDRNISLKRQRPPVSAALVA